MSNHRSNARTIIGPIVSRMTGAKRKEIRKALRNAWTGERTGTAYKVFCDEVAIALRERSRRPLSHDKPKAGREIMPSMRDWSLRHGLVEVTAVFDVDGIDAPPPQRRGIPGILRFETAS